MPKINQSQSRNRQLIHKSYWRSSLTALMQVNGEKESNSEINVGKRLQELRVERGLSLRSLADLSGLNFNTLSLIENEKTSPNINTLQQLATALQVPITSFFDCSYEEKNVVFQKYGERPHTLFPHGELQDMGGGIALGEATPLLMTSLPNSDSGEEMYVHTGQEFVYCLEGSIVYYVGNQKFSMEAGDSLIFEAHLPHRWENHTKNITTCILIICPSDSKDRLVEQHLNDSISQ